MSDASGLRGQLREDLRTESIAVTLTAIPTALVVGLGVTGAGYEFAVGFALLLLVGVVVPHVHEQYWSGRGGWRYDVCWTLGASALACGGFAACYAVATRLAPTASYAAGVAFLGALAIAGLLVAVAERAEHGLGE